MLIKLKDLYERIFASSTAGEVFDKSQQQVRETNSLNETEYRLTDNHQQTTTIKDKAQ